jgi:hypothetical protein
MHVPKGYIPLLQALDELASQDRWRQLLQALGDGEIPSIVLESDGEIAKALPKWWRTPMGAGAFVTGGFPPIADHPFIPPGIVATRVLKRG